MYGSKYKEKILNRGEKKVKNSFNWNRAFLVLTILILFFGFTLLIRLPFFQIKEINVSGAKSVFPDDVVDLVNNTLSGNHLYFYPKKSIFLLPDVSLKKQIKESFPRFKEVEVRRSSNEKISVYVQEYEIKYLWCESDTKCSFMSQDGTAFSDSPFFSGDVYIKIFGGIKKNYPFMPIGNDELEIIEKLNRRLGEINISPAEFHFKRDANNKLIVVFYHNQNPVEIYFDTTISLDMSLDAFYATLRDFNFNQKFRNKTLKLLYVDLMLPNKVTYNFK